MSNKPSIFTQIINREIPATFHYEDDQFIVIDDIHPAAPIHVLIIPKQEIATLEDLPDSQMNLITDLFRLARKMAQQLGISKNYKLFINVGRKVQAIHHLHLHLYGGWDKTKSRAELDKETNQYLNSL